MINANLRYLKVNKEDGLYYTEISEKIRKRYK